MAYGLASSGLCPCASFSLGPGLPLYTQLFLELEGGPAQHLARNTFLHRHRATIPLSLVYAEPSGLPWPLERWELLLNVPQTPTLPLIMPFHLLRHNLAALPTDRQVGNAGAMSLIDSNAWDISQIVS